MKLDDLPNTDLLDKDKRITRQWRDWFFALWDTLSLDKDLDGPLAISVGASPFAYQNNEIAPPHDGTVLVQGGTVSKIEISRDGTNYYDTGVTAGCIPVSYLDFIQVTYTVAPTMTIFPR